MNRRLGEAVNLRRAETSGGEQTAGVWARSRAAPSERTEAGESYLAMGMLAVQRSSTS